MMRQPDWQTPDGRVRLWCGDCLEILPALPKVDAVVTDPPYENMKGGVVIDHAGVTKRRVTSTTLKDELGNAAGLALFSKLATRGAISFCSFHWISKCLDLLQGEPRCLISWFKRNSPYSVNNAPWYRTEYAWAVQYSPGIDWRNLRTHIDSPMLQAGCMASERIVDGGKAVHPAQKPVEVMQAVICPGMDSICDPYMGLGTTGVACVRLGRQFIGIEKEPKYFDIAVKRITREIEQGTLAFPEPERFEPVDLFAEPTH